MGIGAGEYHLNIKDFEGDQKRLEEAERIRVRVELMLEDQDIKTGDYVLIYSKYQTTPYVKKFKEIRESKKTPGDFVLLFENGSINEFSSIAYLEKVHPGKVKAGYLEGTPEEQIEKQGILGDKDEDHYYIVEVTLVSGKKFVGLFIGEPEPRTKTITETVIEINKDGEEVEVEKERVIGEYWPIGSSLYQIWPQVLGKDSIEKIKLLSKVKRQKIQTEEEEKEMNERIKRRERRNS